MESYLSIKSTQFNDVIAVEGMKAFAKCKQALIDDKITYKERELLMYASCAGGIAITHTGTTIVHAMGYSLTYFKGFSHGMANAMIIGEYLRFNQDKEPEKINKVLDILGFGNIDEADTYFNTGAENKPVLSDEEIGVFTELAMGQGSVRMNPKKVKDTDIFRLYRKLFGGAK